MADILVVDDDESIVQAFKAFLADEGHTCRVASTVDDAVRAVTERRPDLVISDVRMPGADGLEGLQRMRDLAPGLAVIIMTAYGTSQTSIEAMRLGAFDYLSKPLDLDDLRALIKKALAVQRAAPKDAAREWDPYGVVALVGNSASMVEVYKMIGVLATNEVVPLILGERGVGKQLIARTIHANSARKEGPFVAIDCRALPEQLLEGELLGATTLAAGGSLFLSGIDALSATMQARLAKLLTERRANRPPLGAGGAAGAAAPPRVIVASEQELVDLVRQGTFSRELYDLVGVILLRVPPLRERRADIPELVTHFIRRSNDELGRSIAQVDDAAMRLLVDHTWPGNVAELEVTIKRASILARGQVITPDDLKSSLEDTELPGRRETETALEGSVRAALRQRLGSGDPAAVSAFHDIVGLVEEGLVREALAITGGNQLRAAELLGVNRATLRKKMNVES